MKITFDYLHLEQLRKALDANDAKLFYQLLDSYFRGVPHTIFKKSWDITNVEAFYNGVLSFGLQLLPKGHGPQSEQTSSDGSADLFLKYFAKFYIKENPSLKL